MKIPIVDDTRTLIDQNPAKFQEYLALENALCSPFGEAIPVNERERAEHRLDLLFRFFRFEYTRTKYGTNFWGRPAAHGDSQWGRPVHSDAKRPSLIVAKGYTPPQID